MYDTHDFAAFSSLGRYSITSDGYPETELKIGIRPNLKAADQQSEERRLRYTNKQVKEYFEAT